MKFLYLALGGSIGAILRYLVSLYSIKHMAWGFPMGTLLVNLIGSFLIGFAFVLLGREQIALNLKVFLFIGIFGSLLHLAPICLSLMSFLKWAISKWHYPILPFRMF